MRPDSQVVTLSQAAPELIDMRLVELPELLPVVRQLASDDPGRAQATYADTAKDATAMTTLQIAMTVFASTSTPRSDKEPDLGTSTLSDLAAG